MQANLAVKWDWLTAGFACFQPAPYLDVRAKKQNDTPSPNSAISRSRFSVRSPHGGATAGFRV